MKRSIAICLLVLASSIWLAHAIIPHHHHQSQVCLLTKHCQHDHDHQSDQPETDSHKHDNNTTSECSLNILAIVPQPIFKSGVGFPEPPQFDTGFDLIQAIITRTHAFVLLSPVTHTDYIDSESTTLYLASLGKSLGLRAPPAV